MLLAHDDTSFPYRRQLLITAIAFLALASFVIPLDGMAPRVFVGGKVFLIGALAYGSVVLILEFESAFMPRFAKLYALFCYYGGILGALISPVMLAFDTRGGSIGWASFSRAEFYAELLPQIAAGLCAAAAAFKWLSRPHAV